MNTKRRPHPSRSLAPALSLLITCFAATASALTERLKNWCERLGIDPEHG